MRFADAKTYTRALLTLNGALALLMAILYGPLVVHWVDGWVNESISIQHEYFSHGLIGLPFAAYLAWQLRQQWQQLPGRCHPVGIGLVVCAAGLYLTGLTDWMSLSLPLMLAGLLLCLKSVAGLRAEAMPLLLVALATPTHWIYLIEPYILPLQRGIAAMAGFLLTQFGVDVTVENIYLYVNGQTVEVAPHCAGLKILFTSIYVAIMLLYWTQIWTSKIWTVSFLVGTVALSITGNLLRNALLTYVYGTGRSGIFHWLHEGWGGDVYSSLMLLSLIGLLLAIQRWVPRSLTVKNPSSLV
jgi:cyanoexosortase B